MPVSVATILRAPTIAPAHAAYFAQARHAITDLCPDADPALILRAARSALHAMHVSRDWCGPLTARQADYAVRYGWTDDDVREILRAPSGDENVSAVEAAIYGS